MRWHYQRLAEELESQVLTISTERLGNPFVREKPEPSLTDGELTIRELRRAPTLRWKEVNGEWTELPAAYSFMSEEFFIEYFYLIDLDREIFGINGAVYFKLSNIPRPQWIDAFGGDEEREEIFDFASCPEAFKLESVRHPRYVSQTAEPPAILANNKIHTVTAGVPQDFATQATPRQLLALLIFNQLRSAFAHQYNHHLPLWSEEDFGFRELAFTIVSLAAGDFRFDRLDRYEGHERDAESEGFFVHKDKTLPHQLVPILGSGYHLEGKEPGSAPCPEVMYWWKNVLICLEPYGLFEDDRDVAAALAKVNDEYLKHGRKSAQAVILTISEEMLMDLQVVDGIVHVQKSERLRLFAEPDDVTMETTFSVSELPRTCETFAKLQHFFHVANKRHLKLFSRGRLPMEIYANIIEHVPVPDRESCSYVSWDFYTLAEKTAGLCPGLELQRIAAPNVVAGCTWWRIRRTGIYLKDLGLFDIQKDATHSEPPIVIDRTHEGRHRPIEAVDDRWCLIVGTEDRPSMVTRVCFQLSA